MITDPDAQGGAKWRGDDVDESSRQRWASFIGSEWRGDVEDGKLKTKTIPACKVTKEGRGFTLEHGGRVALFDAEPPGFYGVQITTICGEPVQVFLSNEGAVCLLSLLYGEANAGKLEEGFRKMGDRKPREVKP